MSFGKHSDNLAYGYTAFSNVSSSLSDGVISVYNTDEAFAALKDDGSVVTWGRADQGGDSSSVSSELAGNVTDIYPSATAFVALKLDGTIVSWGSSYATPPSPVNDVLRLYAGWQWYVALTVNGSVQCWGDGDGGDCSNVASQLSSGVTDIIVNWYAAAELKED